MVYYLSYNFTSSDVAAAVAECILHEIRINKLGLNGFPQIIVKSLPDKTFLIKMSHEQLSQDFVISLNEAKRSVKLFKDKLYNTEIFDRVQDNLSKLEGVSVNKC